MTEPEVVITPENFYEYFYDVRKSKPKKGQVMARFTAVAEFVEGRGKRDIMALLKQDKAYQAAQVMRKIHGAREPDCYRICREIAQDMLNMSELEVEKKSYEFLIELFFYTQREYVPKNDPHWETIPLIHIDSETGNIKSLVEI
jgi:hypothetical protein